MNLDCRLTKMQQGGSRMGGSHDFWLMEQDMDLAVVIDKLIALDPVQGEEEHCCRQQKITSKRDRHDLAFQQSRIRQNDGISLRQAPTCLKLMRMCGEPDRRVAKWVHRMNVMTRCQKIRPIIYKQYGTFYLR